MKTWRQVPGYRWCMLEGDVVDVYQDKVGHRYVHELTDGTKCTGEHRAIATLVTAQEYPEWRRVSP